MPRASRVSGRGAETFALLQRKSKGTKWSVMPGWGEARSAGQNQALRKGAGEGPAPCHQKRKELPIRILFCHGLKGSPNGRKATALWDAGHDVTAPALPQDDFDASIRAARVLHGIKDDVVPLADSIELEAHSGLP